jgi:hypothetical protein
MSSGQRERSLPQHHFLRRVSWTLTPSPTCITRTGETRIGFALQTNLTRIFGRNLLIDRRQFLKLTAATGADLAVPWSISRRGSGVPRGLRAAAMPAAPGLSDPALQAKFVEYAPNALDPGFLFKDLNQMVAQQAARRLAG